MATHPRTNPTSDISLAEKIRSWRKGLGMTQGRLEQLANLGHNSISRIEKSEVSPRLETVEKIANAMGITLEELQFGKPRQERKNNFPDDVSDLERRILCLDEPLQTKARGLIEDLLDLLEGRK